MKKKKIKLKYPSLDNFAKHHDLIKKGKLFIPTATPQPVETELSVSISLQGIDRVFSAEGRVLKVFTRDEGIDAQGDPAKAGAELKATGMLLVLTSGLDKMLADLEIALKAGESPVPEPAPEKKPEGKTEQETVAVAEEPAKQTEEENVSVAPAGSPLPGGDNKESPAVKSRPRLTVEWLRKAVSKEIADIEEEAEEVEPLQPQQKNKLSLEEQKVARPACEFVMDLTKAMSRSGYYDPDHPGSIDAKQGLHESLVKSLGDVEEIMIFKEETREGVEMHISGILEEPVNIRTVVGDGVAELFLPKLSEYFNRKDLVSLTIKKSIPVADFNRFVDIMNDPLTEQKKGSEVSEFLTNALIENGITDISTVYKDDLVDLDSKLPWETEMAVQRLVKDLKVLPKIKGESEAELRAVTEKLIKDIIRPLRHNPQLLKDMALNCESITTNIDGLVVGEICGTVANSLPKQMLLPTSKLIFDDLKKIIQEVRAQQSGPAMDPEAVANLNRRQASAESVLKQTTKRVLAEKSPGANKFIEEMYFSNIVTYDELPYEVQYNVDTATMVDDIRANTAAYLEGILTAKTAEDAELFLKCVQRAVPLLFESKDWSLLHQILKAGDEAAAGGRTDGKKGTVEKQAADKPAVEKETTVEDGPPANQFVPLFYDYIDQLTIAYMEVDGEQRREVDLIVRHMGPMGIEILNRVMAESKNFGAQQCASDSLLKLGDLAGSWVYKALNDPNQPAHAQKSALKIMGFIGKGDNDLHKVRRFLVNQDPELRCEALISMLRLKAGDAEALIIRANNDKDKKVRKVALSSLKFFSPLSISSLGKLLKIVKAKQPEEREEIVEHARKVAMLLRAIIVLARPDDYGLIEEALIEVVGQLNAQKGFLSFLRRSADKEQTILLNAAIEVFERISSEKSVAALEDLAASDIPLAEKARTAVERIRRQNAG